MSRFTSQLQRIQSIIESYTGETPFQHYLKNYFTKNKNAGSRDRKIIRNACYTFFRTGNMFKHFLFTEKLACSYYLCSDATDEFIQSVFDASLVQPLQNSINKPLNEKFQLLKKQYPEIDIKDLFPCYNNLSENFKNESFLFSHFNQPNVWLRVNNGFIDFVKQDLTNNKIPFEFENNIIKLQPASNATDLDSFAKGGFEIMDKSSFATTQLFEVKDNETWWDACCGAGGKTLALIDTLQSKEYKNVSIACTDIRIPILKNLKERILKTGFTKFKNQPMNAAEDQWPDGVLFNKIIVDAPCSGSGTWGRNPENLLQFDSLLLPVFSQKQFDILNNCLQCLKKNGVLYYITCSVFADENEGVINKIDKEKYSVLFSKYISGSDDGADTLYISAIKKA